MIIFTWDRNKNEKNILKHGVSFDEAMSIFNDDYGILIKDDIHSIEEERFILIGISNKGNILVASHCYRNEDEIIRIISVRKATKNEIKQYYWRKNNEKGIRFH